MRSTLRRIWLELSADRRKFGVLCTVFAVGLLLWARLIVVSQMPRMAIADDPPTTKAESAPAATDRRAPVAQVRLQSQPRVDPFAVSDAHFPRPVAAGENAEIQGKSQAEAVDVDDAVSVSRRERLVAAVGSLSLDAVMPDASLAIIDGTLRRVGDRVPTGGDSRIEFLLTEVRQRSVVLAFDDHRFELRMRGPLD